MTAFKEIQRFRQKWLYALVLTPFILAIPFIQGVFEVAVTAATALAVIAFLHNVKLKVKVEEDGIHIKLFPLHLEERVIEFDEIESFSAENYSPLREFGGWGLRWRPGKIAYSTSGSEGVRIRRENKKDVMIGSQKPEKLAKAIEERKK